MIIPRTLLSDGAVPFFMNDGMSVDSYLGPQGYFGSVPRGTLTAVAGSDVYAGGLRYTPSGVIRLLDATAGLPANPVYVGGVAVSQSGQLCITTDPVTASSVFVQGGLACQQDGAVHFVDMSPAAMFRYGIGITVTGAGVSQWNDMSGNARHLLQATDTNRPALQAEGSILFDGMDNFMATGAFTFNQPCTYYLLLRQVSWTANDYLCDGLITAGIFQDTTTPQIAMYAGASVIGTQSNLEVGAYGVLAAVFNGASSSLRVNNNSPVSGDAGANNPGGFQLGSFSGPSNFSHIQAKEAILYSGAHSTILQNYNIARLASVGSLTL